MKVQIHDLSKDLSHKKILSTLRDTNGIVSVFDTHLEAEAGVKQMQQAGYDMTKLSIVGRDFQTEENIIGFYSMGDRTKYWGKLGAFWGGVWGLLFGSAVFFIPGAGPIIVAGSFVTALVAAIEGAAVVGGATALGAALFSIGIPKNSVVQYETDVKAGKYVVIAHGTIEDLNKAREILTTSGAKNLANLEGDQEGASVTTH